MLTINLNFKNLFSLLLASSDFDVVVLAALLIGEELIDGEQVLVNDIPTQIR